ncbi:MAG: putative nucleotidyltransferase [Verrucomicrobiales bacterium]|jgi:predicted nucleotidyltransferase
MNTEITKRLGELEAERGIRILYACESGSRAWGFASPDSDYDVRFIYAHDPEWYMSIHSRDETIDLELEGLLDFSGWDLRKALRLFAKSNGALLEWLHSPIVYREDTQLIELWRSLVPDIVGPKALACHYLGQCKRIWHGSLQADEVRAKHYLYALRSLLAAKWVLERRGIPVVEFARLIAGNDLPSTVADALEGLVNAKEQGCEGLLLRQDRVLHPFIDLQLEALDAVARQMIGSVPDTELIDAFLRHAIKHHSHTPRSMRLAGA